MCTAKRFAAELPFRRSATDKAAKPITLAWRRQALRRYFVPYILSPASPRPGTI